MANDEKTQNPTSAKPESFISVDELIDHIVRKSSDLTSHQIERRENRWRAIIGIVFGALTASGFAGLFYFVDQQIRTTKQEIKSEISEQMALSMDAQFQRVQQEVGATVDERFRQNVDEATAFTNFLVITNWLGEEDRIYEQGDAGAALIYLERLSSDYSTTQNKIFLWTLEKLVTLVYNKDDWNTLREIDRLVGDRMENSAEISRRMYNFFTEEFLSQVSIDDHNKARFGAYLSHRTGSWTTQIARDYAQLAWLLYQDDDENQTEDEKVEEIGHLLQSIHNAPKSSRDSHQYLIRSIYRRHNGRTPQSHESILMTERIEEISEAYDYPPSDYLLAEKE